MSGHSSMPPTSSPMIYPDTSASMVHDQNTNPNMYHPPSAGPSFTMPELGANKHDGFDDG